MWEINCHFRFTLQLPHTPIVWELIMARRLDRGCCCMSHTYCRMLWPLGLHAWVDMLPLHVASCRCCCLARLAHPHPQTTLIRAYLIVSDTGWIVSLPCRNLESSTTLMFTLHHRTMIREMRTVHTKTRVDCLTTLAGGQGRGRR